MSEVDAKSQTISVDSVDVLILEAEKDDPRMSVETPGLEIQ